MSVTQRERKRAWHVVLAEDDDYAIVVERALEKASDVPMKIRRARTGAEALALLRDVVPDLLLLDLKMPGMAGHEALEEIKGDDALRSIPVAILSSSDRDDDVAKSYGLGGNHYITKPSNPIELEAKLRGLLRNLTELGAIRRGSPREPHRLGGDSSGAVGRVDDGGQSATLGGRRGGVGRAILLREVFGGVLARLAGFRRLAALRDSRTSGHHTEAC